MITGCSSGLGLATARLFVERNWNVVATMRRPDQASLLDQHPSIRVVEMELTSPASVEAAVRSAMAAFGRIDVLVNNAGYCLMGPLETTSMQQIREQFETNFFGTIGMIQAVLPVMRQQGCGRIVNISSISADNGYPFVSLYGATKAAVANLSESLNIELHDAGILVKAVHPGLIATSIFEKLAVASSLPNVYRPLLQRFLDQQAAMKASLPEECARVVVRAATDRRPERVHYYAGRDALMVRRLKRLLGQDRTFRLFRHALLHGLPSWMKWFLPAGSTTVPIHFNIPDTPSTSTTDKPKDDRL
jgi:NAD(P)-dependent dehydrogenase (short-subunit alcohol dehydrogenase family)